MYLHAHDPPIIHRWGGCPLPGRGHGRGPARGPGAGTVAAGAGGGRRGPPRAAPRRLVRPHLLAAQRDLKCDNIFVNGTSGVVKIGDLGLATLWRG